MAPPASGPISRLRAHARISAVEIAIRAQAKRFLAHPLVVQQLEAVWAGTIVFHSAADTLHRQPSQKTLPGASGYGKVPFRSVSYQDSPGKGKGPATAGNGRPVIRRIASLYDPSDASIFKLSRLRV